MKGLSQIITAVLVLAVGISVSTIFAGWAPDFAENTTEQFVDQQESDIECRNAQLRVYDGYYSSVANELLVSIRNTGTIRFSDTITFGALKDSSIIGENQISSLDVGQQRTNISIDVEEKPDEVIAIPSQCPSVEGLTRNIQ